MDDDEPCIAETIVSALAVALLRKGALDPDDIASAADDLDAEGETTAAHVLRCSIVAAEAPTASEWQAEQRRKRIRLIEPGADGGN